jgi:hypothetical protein
MAYIYTPFMKKILYITKRKWKSNIQHDCKSNDFRAGFEVAEWGVFCHSKTLQISPARFKQVYSDSAHPGAIASSNVALPYSYGFLPRTLTQNVQPKTELFRDRYRCHVHARCLPPDENSMDNVCNTSLPIG